MRRLPLGVIAAAAALVVPMACGAGAEQAASVAIDTTVRYQEMGGWEVTSQAGQEEPGYGGWRDTLMNLAAADGIDRIRLELRSGMENPIDRWAEMRARGGFDSLYRCQRYETINDDADPSHIRPGGFQFSDLDFKVRELVLPLKRAVEARGRTFRLSLTYVGFNRGTGCNVPTTLHRDDPAEYAEFVLAASLHLRQAHGLVPDAWEIILEPDVAGGWSGRRIGEAIVATSARLRAAGFTPTFVAPSTTSMSAALSYIDELAAHPGALTDLRELSYHRYRGVSDLALAGIAERAGRHGLRTAMLEHIGSGIDDLFDDLTRGQASAWSQYTLAYPGTDNGGHYYLVGDGPPRPGRYIILLRQVFRHVAIGARRVAAGVTGPVRAAAFVNRDGSIAVAIKAAGPTEITVHGLAPGRYGIGFATDTEPDGAMPVATVAPGAALTTRIPGAGVLSVYGVR